MSKQNKRKAGKPRICMCRMTWRVLCAAVALLALRMDLHADVSRNTLKPSSPYIYKETPDRQLRMEMTYPDGWQKSDNRPAIIFFYNGGWQEGKPNLQFGLQAKYFARRGAVIAQADYREKDKSGVTSEKCMEDIFSAARWLRANAETLGIDPNRIAAAGGSGSGHLAASAFYMDELCATGDDPSISPRLGALMLFNPDLDVLDPQIMERMLGGDPDHARQMPPTLAFYGTRDVSHTLIADFASRARNLGMPVEAFVGKDAVHGFFKFSPWLEKTTLRADEFLQSAGILEPEPRAELPSKARPGGYDANVEASMERWLERHEELAEKRKKDGGTPSVADPAPTPGSKTDDDPRLADLLQRFPEADADKDGVLTMEEARAHRGKMQRPNKTGPAADKTGESGGEPSRTLFVPSRDWDVNKDGKIGRDEFKAPANLFNNLDYDDSGFLNGDELIKLDSKLDLSKTGDSIWSVPPETQYHGVEHQTYFSQAMQTEVGYNIYLPDDYKASKKRYPVIYHLHGSGGNESAQIDLSGVYHQAIAAHKMSPVIIVFVNGGKRSYYCDSADGKIKSETTIIRELIPHIDATYRTIPEKTCRVIHGFSMGGFGAMRLAAKYPDLFCAVLSFGGGMAPPGSVHELFLTHILGNNARLFAENNPADLVARNKSALAGMTFWLFSGTKDVALEDSTWAHEFLQSQQVPDRFEVSEDVGHTLKKHYTFFGDDIFQMLQKHFAASASWLSGSAAEKPLRRDDDRIGLLKSDDAKTRKEAAIALLMSGANASQAWHGLVSALTEDAQLDHEVAGCVLFAGVPAPDNVPALIEMLNAETRLRVATTWKLMRMGPAAAEAAPALIEALGSEDKHARNLAVIALGMVGPPPEAIPFLVNVIKDAGTLKPPQSNYRYPRASAALVLGLMGAQAKEAVPVLTEMLAGRLAGPAGNKGTTSWEDHRAAAAFALGEIGPDARDAAPDLTRALNDPSTVVQRAARQALQKISTPPEDSVAVLVKALSSDANRQTREAVRAGLRALAGSEAASKPASKGAGKQRLPVHESVAIAAGYLDSLSNPPTAGTIKTNRAEDDADVINYFMALGGIQQGITPALLEALGDEARATRRSAAKALGRIGKPGGEADSALQRALSDDDWMVRCAAADALHRIAQNDNGH